MTYPAIEQNASEQSDSRKEVTYLFTVRFNQLRKWAKFRSILNSLNRVLGRVGLKITRLETNDEVFWNWYARRWKKRPESKKYSFLGDEWETEQVFLPLLQKYASEYMNAVEIGCGGGKITQKAAPLFKSVLALDVSKEMLKLSQQDVKAPNVSWSKINGFDLKEIQDGTFDCVFSHDVFVHFSSLQVYPYFKEINRILKSDGIGLISFFSFNGYFEFFKEESLKYNDERRFPPHFRPHFITSEMIARMLTDLDFTILESEEAEFLVVVFKKS